MGEYNVYIIDAGILDRPMSQRGRESAKELFNLQEIDGEAVRLKRFNSQLDRCQPNGAPAESNSRRSA